jgi:hypothetical protein
MTNNPSNPGGPKRTGFTNISSYLQANSKNRLGQIIGSNIGNAAKQVQTGLGTATDEFNKGAEAGNLATDANKAAREAVLGRIATMGSNTPEVSDQEADQFKTYLAGQYKGPTSLQNEDKLTQAAQRAQALGKSVGSQQGQTGLLQQFVGNPQYTAGQQKLDATLLGQQSAPLREAKQKTMGLTQNVGRESQRAGAKASQYKFDASKFGKETGEAIQGQKTSVVDPLTGRVTTLTDEQNEAIKRIKAGAPKGEFTEADAKMLGLTPGQNLYDINIADELAKVEAPTISGLASDEDRAKIMALAKLSGQDPAKFLEGFDPKAAKFDPNKLVKLRDDFGDVVKYRGDASKAAQDRTVLDLSGSITSPEVNPFIGNKNLNITDPDFSWMKNPGEFKEIPLGVAEQRVNKTDQRFTTEILPKLYKQITKQDPPANLTLADFDKIPMVEFEYIKPLKLARQYGAVIDYAKKQLAGERAKLPTGTQVKIV